MFKKAFTSILLICLSGGVNAQDEPPDLVNNRGDGDQAWEVGLGFQAENADLTANVCLSRSVEIANTYAADQRDVKGDVHAFFYDSSGRPCFVRKSARVTEGDLFVIGYFGKKNGPLKFRASKTTCEVESPDGRIRDQFIDITSDEELQSGGREEQLLPNQIGFRELDKFDCYGAEAKFNVTEVVQDSADIVIDEKSFKQYPRYFATWQLGAVWTELQDRDFRLVNRGAGNVISSRADDSEGPIYVGSVTIYGFPRHVQSWFGDQRYSGRDIINHNGVLDRVGLSFSFGLENPGETLGIGLSYELVRGVSLTYSHLYRKIEVLDGLSEGDTFGSAAIPIQETWESEGVWGFTIDGRLIATFFGGGS